MQRRFYILYPDVIWDPIAKHTQSVTVPEYSAMLTECEWVCVTVAKMKFAQCAKLIGNSGNVIVDSA